MEGLQRPLVAWWPSRRSLPSTSASMGLPRLADLDLANKPTFGFGNSSKNQCVSTASLEVQADGRPGQVQVHALDAGAGPVLFSIESLRALGAIIDFSEDMVVFRKNQPVQDHQDGTFGHWPSAAAHDSGLVQ